MSEAFILDKIKERILTDEIITELVTLVAEEIDAMAGEMNGRLQAIAAEIEDVERRLERLYEALETRHLTLEALSPRILSLRHRQDQLGAARDEAADLLEQRRVDLPTTEEIKGYVADFRAFLQEGTFPERKALIRNFVKGVEVLGDEATLTYTIPMPSDGVTSEGASVLDFVQSGPPRRTKARTFVLGSFWTGDSALTDGHAARAGTLELAAAGFRQFQHDMRVGQPNDRVPFSYRLARSPDSSGHRRRPKRL